VGPLIAIVDDDRSMREAIGELVKSVGYIAASAASAQEFLGSRHMRRTSCLITDMQMPGMTGLELHPLGVGAGKRRTLRRTPMSGRG
jgi:FixJ family two-component response regulator